jgi:parallel beta-helix repeat protein
LYKRGLVLGIIALFIGAGVLPQIVPNMKTPIVKADDLEGGLVSCWHFDEGSGNIAYDTSGNGNDGTINGASWTTGISGTALDYDGINNFVEVDDSSTLNFGEGDFSICAWIKTNNSNVDDLQIVEKLDRDGSIPYHGFYMRVCKNYLYDNVLEAGISVASGDVDETFGTTFLADEKWHFVTATFDRDDKLSIYVDGQLENSVIISSIANIDNAWSLYIGQQANSDNRYIGMLDEICIYNHALTADEIQALYQQFPPLIVYVDDDYTSSTPGWGYDHFDTIQDGIDAVEGSIVYVYNGTYYENIVIDKTINLTGEDRNSTIIDGGGSGNTLSITSNNVVLKDFTIQNGGDEWGVGGIEILGDNSTILHNKIINNKHGVYPCYSYNSTIEKNIILNNYDGIRFFNSSHNQINNNEISSNDFRGIYVKGNSNNNIIQNNTICSNLDDGIHIYSYCDDNIIYQNDIESNGNYGLYIYYPTYTSINNRVYHNNFIDNLHNARDECTNVWDNGYPSGGNYWDDYTGTDADGDGIGDMPYPIPGGSNQDLYPLGYFQNIPPIANFSYAPLNPTDLETIQFTDLSHDSDGAIVNWTWDFDDGNISHLQNPTHQYADDGTYLVNLTVTDNDYEYDSLNRLITVSNVPPVADANGPYTGYVYQLIQFDGSGSYDPDVHGFVDSTRGIVRYEWDFGDGHNGSGMKPTHEYSHPGEYQVNLTVWDDDGATDTNYTFSSIGLQIPPQADANGPYEGHVGESVQFHGSATGGEPPYTWNWDFGNGYSSSLQNPIYIYGETGIYTVVLTVTDDNDNSDDDTTTATIYPENVLLADAGGPYSGFVNESVQFYGNASGGEPPYSWYWEFGDGNTSALQNPTHIYDKVGEYDVILTVTDDFGQNDNDKAFVKILPQDDEPPLVSIQKPDKGKLYIRNRMIFPIFLITVIIGDIVVEAYAIDEITGVSRVEFYLDDNFQFSISSEPYVWTWDERAFGKRTIKVTAYDKAGNSASDEIEVWKFF